MSRFDIRLMGGLLLLAAGTLLLLQNFEVLPFDLAWVWAILTGLGGAFFGYVLVRDRSNWWAIIPAVILLDLAVLIVLDTAWPALGDLWAGSFFLGGVGLAFWLVYLARREHWWAIIPAGVLTTLAVVAGLSDNLPGVDTGGLFFAGLGVTFAVVGLVPAAEGRRMRWPWIPAAALVVLGVLVATPFAQWINVLGPAALVVAGVIVLIRALRPRVS